MDYKYRRLIMWILKEIAFMTVVQMTHREKSESIRSIINYALSTMDAIQNGRDVGMDDIPY